jgi:hypothetical protein
MPGFMPGIHVFETETLKTWMAGQKGIHVRFSTAYAQP